MHTLSYVCDGLRCSGKVAQHGAFIWHIGSVDDMLFQHDDTRSSPGAGSVVIGMLLAEEVVAREVGGMAAE